MNILLVDDDVMVSSSIANFLKYVMDMQVDSISDPSHALWLFSQHNYDVVLCDVNMPGIDGFKLINCMKKVTKPNPVEYVIITGFPTLINRAKALENKIEHFLTKPININQLVQIIDNLDRNLTAKENLA